MPGSNSDQPQPVEVLGKPFKCPVCEYGLFFQGKAQLNTRLATFFKLDWVNRRASHLTCAQCRHMSWFNQD